MSKIKAYALAAITGIAFWILVFGYVFGATVPTTGYVVSTNCATVSNPGAHQIACLQTTTTGGRTAGQMYGWNGSSWYSLTGTGAPTDATYLTQTSNSTLTNEQAMSALSTGIVKNTTTTGVQSIAVSGTDYAPATSGSAILKGNGSGGFSNAAAGTDYAAAPTGTANTPLFNNGSGGFTNGTRSGNTTEVVTATGTLTSGDCAQWDANGNVVASGGPCAAGSGITQLTGDVTAGPGSGSQAATIANAAVTLAKIANAAANDKLLGSGNSGSGASYAEITLGTNLSMSGTTLNASGGGGGPTAITPTDIAGLQSWLKADALVLSDGDPVGSWTDSSGNGNNWTEATNKPTYNTNQINSLPAVTFDATNDTLLSPVTTTGPFTVLVVARAATAFPGANRRVIQSSGENTWLLSQHASGAGALSDNDWQFYNNGATSSQGSFVIGSDTNWAIVTVDQPTANMTTLFVNGRSSQSYNGTLDTSITFNLGNGNSQPGDCVIAEVIVYSGVSLTAVQRWGVEEYLREKYKIWAN
jgi:hypothetical protein